MARLTARPCLRVQKSINGMHTVQLGYQQMFGEHGKPQCSRHWVGGCHSLTLDNWSVASFIRKDERSWSLGYTYNFADVGVPGLTATATSFPR